MTATVTRPERTKRASTARMDQIDADKMILAAIETLTPTSSAPEWAKAESLRDVGNGFGGPY